MATKKISELEAINAADESDVLVVVDVSEGTTNKITKGNLLVGAGHTIEMTIDTNYQLVLKLKNEAGTVLSTQTIDLPNEDAITGITYSNGALTLTKQSGGTSTVDISGLISGLQSEITSENKLSSDLVDDTNKTNKFTNETEKATWNGKYNKPSGGIPKTDLSSEVQTSLEKADSALQEHQDITGKEDKSVTGTDTNTYDTTETYNTGDIVVQSGKIYKCKQDNVTGAFDATKWDEISLYEYQKIQDGKLEDNYKVITKLQTQVNTLKEITSQMPQVSDSGEEAYLADTIEAPFEQFEVKGHSEQETTEGKNILPYPYAHTTKTEKGITFTDNGDGSIKINGTATELVIFFLQWSNTVPAGSYSYITFNLPNNCYANYYGIGNKYGDSVGTVTLANEFNLGASIYIPEGVTVSNVTIYPMLVKGIYTRETIPSWEKYTGGMPSPNPSYEQPIKSAGENGTINEKIQTRNWLVNNAQSKTDGGITFAVNQEEKSITINGTSTGVALPINANYSLPKGTYTVSLNKNQALDSRDYYLAMKKGTENIMGSDLKFNDNTKTFTLSEDTENIIVYLWVGNGITLNNLVLKPQLEPGSTANSYVPHEEQNISIPVQAPFRSIGDVRDDFVKQNGVWYERHKIGEVVFDGSEEGWNTSSLVVNGYKSYYINSQFDEYKEGLSNYFKKRTFNDWVNLVADNFFEFASGSMGFRIEETLASNLNNFKTWLTTHNLVVNGVLINPTLLPCTQAQSDILDSLTETVHTYRGGTYITSPDEVKAKLSVSGLKDLNVMFEDLTNAIISQGANT